VVRWEVMVAWEDCLVDRDIQVCEADCIAFAAVCRATGERVGGSQGVALFELAGRPRISGAASTCERYGRGGLFFRVIAHTAVGSACARKQSTYIGL
jgi:hypothetical protein